ncbi:hypothetical protein [Bradyrhizobium sp. SZCCHNS1054]|uniref:hypothetical protein n=1 Tax=Bradyrhizobium sp. SZCCHNS1054 TaxID=3057301 RepID=UPI00291697BF|nr:hypothetical protein [Bradyrhizobium sp. SZCCHNS1054]
MPRSEVEFIAYLTELRSELTRELADFKSGRWKIYAGGSEMRDVTSERIAILDRRVAEIDKTLLDHRNS